MWQYKNKKIYALTDIPKQFQDYDGFIYKIECKTNGRYYIGKKTLFNRRKKVLSIKARALLKTRKKSLSTIVESDWLKYYGSSKELLNDIDVLGVDKFTRTILKFTKGKKAATAWELHEIITQKAMLDEKSYNGNILGRIFKRDFKNE